MPAKGKRNVASLDRYGKTLWLQGRDSLTRNKLEEAQAETSPHAPSSLAAAVRAYRQSAGESIAVVSSQEKEQNAEGHLEQQNEQHNEGTEGHLEQHNEGAEGHLEQTYGDQPAPSERQYRLNHT